VLAKTQPARVLCTRSARNFARVFSFNLTELIVSIKIECALQYFLDNRESGLPYWTGSQ